MRIGLVLGGGGGRCLAHIGVLQALEDANLTPAAIAACSTGALIGALAAAGHSAATIYDLLADESVLSLISGSLGSGILDQDNIADALRPYLPETFTGLRTPLAVVAADIQTGELHVLREGALVPSVCASNAFPGLFDAVEIGGRHLIDGGVLDNVPTDILKTLTTAPSLAVDVAFRADAPVDLEQNDNRALRVLNAAANRVTLPVAMLRKAYIISQVFITDMRLAMNPPTLLLRPNFPADFGVLDLAQLDQAVDIGYQAATELLEREGHKLRA